MSEAPCVTIDVVMDPDSTQVTIAQEAPVIDAHDARWGQLMRSLALVAMIACGKTDAIARAKDIEAGVAGLRGRGPIRRMLRHMRTIGDPPRGLVAVE